MGLGFRVEGSGFRVEGVDLTGELIQLHGSQRVDQWCVLQLVVHQLHQHAPPSKVRVRG